MKEKKFWEKVRDNLTLDYKKRIENELEPGWPDVFYMHNSFPGWIELKQEKSFPSRVDFEPGQPIWLQDYWEKGGTCYVFLYVEATNQIYVWYGRDARKLNALGGTKECEPVVQTTMNSRGWGQIYDLFNLPAHP